MSRLRCHRSGTSSVYSSSAPQLIRHFRKRYVIQMYIMRSVESRGITIPLEEDKMLFFPRLECCVYNDILENIHPIRPVYRHLTVCCVPFLTEVITSLHTTSGSNRTRCSTAIDKITPFSQETANCPFLIDFTLLLLHLLRSHVLDILKSIVKKNYMPTPTPKWNHY